MLKLGENKRLRGAKGAPTRAQTRNGPSALGQAFWGHSVRSASRKTQTGPAALLAGLPAMADLSREQTSCESRPLYWRACAEHLLCVGHGVGVTGVRTRRKAQDKDLPQELRGEAEMRGSQVERQPWGLGLTVVQ